MSSIPPQPPASAVVWRWRASAVDPRETRRVRLRGALRGGIGLAAATLLTLWKPVLGALAAALAVALLVVVLGSPRGIYPRLERGLAAFARAVGLGVTWITLTAVHLLVFLPLGLLLRATGRLRITRAPDPAAATYWRPPDPPGPPQRRYRRQF